MDLVRTRRAFSAINPTPGTGIAAAATAAFSATAALLNIRNPTEKRVYELEYIRLICTAAGSGTTSSEALVALDTGVARYASGGSQLTPVGGSMQVDDVSEALVRFGALVLNAESTLARRGARFKMRAAIPQVGDEHVIVFGEEAVHAFNTLNGANAQRLLHTVSKKEIGPGQDFVFHMWNPAVGGAPSWEVEAAWTEK